MKTGEFFKKKVSVKSYIKRKNQGTGGCLRRQHQIWIRDHIVGEKVRNNRQDIKMHLNFAIITSHTLTT